MFIVEFFEIFFYYIKLKPKCKFNEWKGKYF